jgi:hypothetical protein
MCNELAVATREMGSEINTNTIFYSESNGRQADPYYNLNREIIKSFKDFVYLGSDRSENACEENEIQRRNCQAHIA